MLSDVRQCHASQQNDLGVVEPASSDLITLSGSSALSIVGMTSATALAFPMRVELMFDSWTGLM